MNRRIFEVATSLTFAVLVFFFATMATGCTDDNTARRVLAQNGYKDIKTTGYDPWMCGKDDDFSTGFEATSPSGQHVTGAVCSAFMKGATIRFK